MRISEGVHFGLALMDRVNVAPVDLQIRRGDQVLTKQLTPQPRESEAR